MVVWDFAKQKRILTLDPRESEGEFPVVSTYAPLVFSPNSLAIATGARSLPGPAHRVILWNAATAKPDKVLRGNNDALVALAHSADGRTLASPSLDRTIKL